MAKRLTSIRISERTDQQIIDLVEKTGHDFTELVTLALERLHYEEMRSRAAEGPIYTKFFIECDAGDEGAFPVHFPFSGETKGYDSYLRPASLLDLVDIYRERDERYPAIYIEVKHALEYPYAKYDAEYTGRDFFAEVMQQESRKRLYAQAAIVATPSMALI